jgi:quercetin dioxygenase-like cupin family protein
MKIIDLATVPKLKMGMEGAEKTHKQLVIGADDGSPNFSVRVFTIEPNGHTPFHSHPSEHLNYVIDGHGVLVREDGEEQEIGRGNFALVLPDEKHQYRNSSQQEPLVMICAVPKQYE